MNKQTTKKAVRVNSIRQAAGSVPGLPGNLIINQKDEVKPENWFSSREWKNSLLGAGINGRTPCYLFKGATLTYERLEITAEDITNGGGSYKHQFPGKDSNGNPRVVEYKQPGIHNINLQVDLSSMPIDVQMSLADLALKHQRTTFTATPVVSTTETFDDPVPVPETIPTPEETVPITAPVPVDLTT